MNILGGRNIDTDIVKWLEGRERNWGRGNNEVPHSERICREITAGGSG